MAGPGHADGLHRLAPGGVGHADHGHVGDIGMAVNGALHLGRVDVLAAADDHVLDPVVDVDIAVGVQVAGVAGEHPAVGGHGAGGGLGLLPVAQHVVGRAGHDLAHLAGGHGLPVAADDLDLDTRHRLAGGAHARAAIGVVVLGRQHHHGAGGLGHAVGLGELAAEGLDALAQQFQGDRCGAIEDVLQATEISLAAARVVDQHLQRRGHGEEAGHAFLLDRIEHTVGRELGHHAAAHPAGQRHDAQAGAADVGAGHGHHHHLVVVPEGPGQHRLLRRPAQAEQVAVAQRHALGVPGGARGVELQHGVLGTAGRELSRRAGVDPGPGLVGRQHPLQLGQVGRHGVSVVGKTVAGDQPLGLGVVHDVVALGRRQAPADRHHHHADARGAEQQREVQHRVLAQPGDAVALLQARGLQPCRHAAGAGVEFGKVDTPLTHHRGPVWPIGGPVADEGVDGEQFRGVHGGGPGAGTGRVGGEPVTL